MEDLQQSILNSDVIYTLTRNLVNPELISDITPNDSNKTLTVPANQIWEVLSIQIEFISTATGGNRLLRIIIRDNSNNNLFHLEPGITQAASLTRYYMFAPNFPRESSFFNSVYLFFPFPRVFLPASYNLLISDASTIDVSADDMIIQMIINRFDV